MAYKQKSPLKQTTKTTTPGYDSSGRRGIITINSDISGGNRTNFSNDPAELKKQKDWITNNPELYKKLLRKKKKPVVSKSKSFKADTITTEPTSGTEVDTFTSPQARESNRRSKVNVRAEKKRGRKAVRSARRMKRMFDKTGQLDIQNEQGEWSTLKGKDAQSHIDTQMGRGKSMVKGGGTIGQVQSKNDPSYTAGEISQGNNFNTHNRPTVEAYKEIKKGTPGGDVKDVKITQEEKDSGKFTNYDDVDADNADKNSVISNKKSSNTTNNGDGSGFSGGLGMFMLKEHSPNKMYKEAKEKSSALKMRGANKVENANKLSFNKEAFNSQSRSTRPMTKKAGSTPFKMNGYKK